MDSIDLDFVCNGDEYAERGALPAIVSMCENSSVPCVVNFVHHGISANTLNRIEKGFRRLCSRHSIRMFTVPGDYMELIDATILNPYGIDCVKLFLPEIVDHKGDVFVYNDCDTLTVADIGRYASDCVAAGLGDKYSIGLARNMMYRGYTQIFKYYGGFYLGSSRMLREGGYVRDVVCRMLAEAPLLPSMHYNIEPKCVDGRILELSPCWLFTRFFTHEKERMPENDLNEFYGALSPVGFVPYETSRYEEFVKCYHFSGPNKPWKGGKDQPPAGVEAWREVDAKCREAMDA